ncbi:disintegrin and metalloproteinase domain-containing protein 32-like isoform X1 [Aquila chrysaetos chrysaetos]|uniref:disintegrin and metalloproteinase domain-containing protein 32-like isoform X1 n=1 Tax=Aquila chrysaetos chrysaetos TaxID=223781 RepID=UPI001B7D3246|nr:disintegrin and metalloproteinase domain-containing protein 32-like isoform X1 [Aquila chrysaetos chrysaetos]
MLKDGDKLNSQSASWGRAFQLSSLKPAGGILLGEERPGQRKVHVVTRVPQRWSRGTGDVSPDSVGRGCVGPERGPLRRWVRKDGEKSPFCLLCQFKQKNSPCRPPADAQCDLAEFCNGSSASCPPDLYVQDGHGCEHGTGYCYKGRCQSPDLQCRRLYGRGSKNAPVACYEELNSQRDRFGHCGFQPRQGYKSCAWRNLRCGKLICTYPYSTPFPSEAAAVLYVQVREHLCISLDYLNAPARLDPLLVPPGTKCGSGKVCINNTCHPHSVLGYDCDSKVKCHGHGVCNNKRHCHCHPGWKPPDCLRKGSGPGGSVDSGLQLTDGGLSLQRALEDVTLAWPVLGSCLLLLLLTGAVCLVLRRQAQPPNTEGPAAEEGSDGRDTDVDTDTDTEPGPGPGRGC